MKSRLTKDERALVRAYDKLNRLHKKYYAAQKAYGVMSEKRILKLRTSKEVEDAMNALCRLISENATSLTNPDGKTVGDCEVCSFYILLHLSKLKEKEDVNVITATIRELKHSPLGKSFGAFGVGDRVESSLGVGHIISLDKPTGNCRIRLEKMV